MGILIHLLCLISLALQPLNGIRSAGAEPAAGEERRHAGNSSGEQDQGIPKSDFKIKVNVELVPVDVTVYGTPVHDLQAEDFVVYDNNIAQPVIYFSRDQLPLAVALVVDSSGSLTSYLPELQTAARSALGTLKPEDQVVLFGFAAFPARLTDFTHDHALIVQKLASFTTAGSTNIWDALFVAARYLRGRAPDRRRAIILISDNGQIINWGQTWKSALQEMLESGITLYAIETLGTGSLYAESDSVRKIAGDTGGETLSVGSGKLLSAALNQSISYLRMQYTLGFAPSAAKKDGAFHNLTVRLNSASLCPDCRLHARKGYFAGTPPPSGAADSERKKVPPGTHVEPVVYNRITIAAADMAELNDIPFEIKTARAPGVEGRLQTRVDLQIDPAKVHFRMINGLYTASLCIALFSALSDGVFFATDWKILDVQMQEDMYRRVLTSGIVYTTQIRGAPDALKAVVCDQQSDAMGSKRVKTR
jgi:VWFA-related protein